MDGVTKLSKIHFESQEEHQAENYRKLIVSMSSDIRVLVIKLADRLHNMRTLAYMTKPKQIQKAKETLEVYAPLAHRLGINSLKWELEDLAFATLHPKRYSEIQQMVNQRRPDREAFIDEAGEILGRELEEVAITGVEITGRAKHFYSIYEKMTRKGKEFNEIYDLTAMRVLVNSVKDCYGAVGIIHSLWKPLPGRFKDYIAMPKLNMYQSLHTTVIGPGGKPLEIQIRTYAMHATAEFGVAAHWLYKEGRADQPAWVSRMMDWQRETHDPGEFLEALRSDLYSDEVYVFTPKGDVRDLPAGATPLDFAYDVHTDVGHRCVGAKVNGRIVPLTYTLQSGDFVEILTSKAPRAPSRDWLQLVTTTKARSKISQFFRRERREDAEHQGREALQDQLRKAGLPSQRLAGLAAAAGGHPGDGLQEGRRVLHLARPRQDLGPDRGQQDPPAAEGRPGGRRRRGPGGHPARPAPAHRDGVERAGHRDRRPCRRPRAPRQVLQACSGRPDPGLHLARSRHHDPPRGLPQREGPEEEPRALHPGLLERREPAVLSSRDRRQRLG